MPAITHLSQTCGAACDAHQALPACLHELGSVRFPSIPIESRKASFAGGHILTEFLWSVGGCPAHCCILHGVPPGESYSGRKRCGAGALHISGEWHAVQPAGPAAGLLILQRPPGLAALRHLNHLHDPGGQSFLPNSLSQTWARRAAPLWRTACNLAGATPDSVTFHLCQ